MKAKLITIIWMCVMLLAILACQVPSGSEPTTTDRIQPSSDEPSVPAPTDLAIEPETSTQPILTPTGEMLPLLPVFSNPEIFELVMFTPTHGWAVTQDQDHLLITEDGGSTWLDATPPDLSSLPSGYNTLGIEPYYLDENTAWFTPTSDAGGLLYHTQDGGISWTSTPVPFVFAHYDFLDLYTGYALVDLGAGAGSHYIAIYRTLDGGASWTLSFTHEPGESKSLREGGTKNGITFRNIDYGWIGGSIPMDNYVYLFYTEDGGVTWMEETDIAIPGIFNGSLLVGQPEFFNPNSAFLPVKVFSPDGSCFLIIYRSVDYGQTWSFQGSIEDGVAVDFHTIDEGWLVSRSGLYHTTDGGITWSEMTTLGIPAGEIFLKVNFVDSLHGWVLATPDDMTWNPLKLYRTTDGGVSWDLIQP